MEQLLKKYIEITGDDESNILSGLHNYGPTEIEKLLQEAINKKSRLVFYYETDDDLLMDNQSYRFE